MKRRLCILITVIMLGVTPLAGSAQEATADVGVPVVGIAPDPANVVRDTGTALSELIAAFLSGAVVSGATVLVTLRSLVRTVDQNPVLTTAIERLYMSLPADSRTPLREAVTTLKEGVDLVDRLTDEDLTTGAVG